MQNSDPRDRIVYPIHKLMIDSYNPLNHCFLKVERLSCPYATLACHDIVTSDEKTLREFHGTTETFISE